MDPIFIELRERGKKSYVYCHIHRNIYLSHLNKILSTLPNLSVLLIMDSLVTPLLFICFYR